MSLSPELNQITELDTAAVLGVQTIEGLPEGFFNAAAWGANGGSMLLGRLVERQGEPDAPDIGSLALTCVRNGVADPIIEVWRPQPSTEMGDLIEDIRAFTSGQADDELVLGVTRLSPVNGRYEPFPAYCTTTTSELLSGVFPPTHYIAHPNSDKPSLWLPPGKNATPLGKGRFMFRPETDDHGFLAFSLNGDGTAEAQQRLALPPGDIPYWGQRKIGSTMPPVWLNDHEALLIMHGIRMAKGKYVYSIGSARLLIDEDEQLHIDNLSPNPHLTPESFRHLFPGKQVELHPELRQAVYLCGGVVEYEEDGKTPILIKTYPNVGDTRTVEATFSVAAIIRAWDRTGSLESLLAAVA